MISLWRIVVGGTNDLLMYMFLGNDWFEIHVLGLGVIVLRRKRRSVNRNGIIVCVGFGWCPEVTY